MTLSKTDYDELVRIGGQMATVCVNLGQESHRAGPFLVGGYARESMYQLAQQWDKKLAELRVKRTPAKGKR